MTYTVIPLNGGWIVTDGGDTVVMFGTPEEAQDACDQMNEGSTQ